MAASIAYQAGAIDTANATTYTFSSQSFGAAATNRHIIVCIEARALSGSPTVSTVTVGGVSATAVQAVTNPSNVAAIWIAAVPTGTTGDVVVTFSGGMLRAAVQIYRATELDSATAHDSTTSTASAPNSGGAVDVPTGGVAVGCGCVGFGTSGTSVSWSGLTEDYDAVVETFLLVSSASKSFPSGATGETWTATFSGVGTAGSQCGVFASWGAAATGSPLPVFMTHYRRLRSN